MSATPDISKLPKWAQERIKDLEREREMAVRTLNEFKDSQTPSPVFYDEMVCTGEEQGPSNKRRFIQTHWINVHHAGVELRVLLRDNLIDLQWSSSGMRGDVCYQPHSWQQIHLLAKENML